MKILIACEESQRVCIEMRRLGHEAYSCDVQEPSGGHPEWHILGDVLEVLNPEELPFGGMGISFWTMDGEFHLIDGRWDMIIAHPPCTYLSNAGACRLYPQNADCEKIAVENPIPSKVFELPPCTQTIQPYEHGHPYSKKTCLWLKGLPKLMPSNVLSEYKPYVSCGTSKNKGNKDKSGVSRAGGASKIRSKTFPGIARAMAEQWAGDIKENPRTGGNR